MKHLDLFSGIGGFAYAVDQVWENVEHIFCDNDKFCQQVLKKHWPNSKIYDDIRQITANTTNKRPIQPEYQKRPRQKERVSSGFGECFLLTGGFPCQPFSQAGKRRGTNDDRYLWPEMLRVIQLTQPQWVIAENVRGLLTQQGGVVFEQVCIDLEGEGYSVQPFIIPACAVNAPHRRDRVWIVGNAKDKGRRERNRQKNGNDKWKMGECGQEGNEIRADGGTVSQRYDWSTDWLEVATELCRMDDGISTGLDLSGYTYAQHRVQRLKALGNSIVPQVAIEIMKSIKQYG